MTRNKTYLKRGWEDYLQESGAYPVVLESFSGKASAITGISIPSDKSQNAICDKCFLLKHRTIKLHAVCGLFYLVVHEHAHYILILNTKN